MPLRLLIALLALGWVPLLNGCQATQQGTVSPSASHDVAKISSGEDDFSKALALFSQGYTHELRGDIEHAIDYYQKALRLDPKNEKLYLRAVSGFIHLNKHDEAIQLEPISNSDKPLADAGYVTGGMLRIKR